MKILTHGHGRFLGRLLLLLGLVATLGLLANWAAAPAYAYAASTLTVTNCSDDSQLQADVSQANKDNNGDTITFACGGDILLSRTLIIAGRMTIDGSNQSVTLDGSGQLQVFLVDMGVNFTLNAITVANGSINTGGGDQSGYRGRCSPHPDAVRGQPAGSSQGQPERHLHRC
ncbi:MAG TPA: hypothetical protein VFA09_13975 [Ktedonobacteraceae bacterium]|jgi:hypothetical protein|nr:hypothetical protein [Ktedonobacteraceae bacterium]